VTNRENLEWWWGEEGYYTMVSMEIAAAGVDVPSWADTVAAAKARA
jgi:hypothetical protein